VRTRGWTSRQGFTVSQAAEKMEGAGVVNLLVTAVGQDGTAKGPDVPTLRKLCSSTKKMRFVASGGVRDVFDLKDLAAAGAHGAVIGRALYDGSVKLRAAKAEMAER